jgi:exodeoxyribonuclease VII small subunit
MAKVMEMAKTKPTEKLNYEQAFEELEALVEQLESGDLPLEEALGLFERGQALAARCSELLEQAELRLRQLVPDQSGGYVETDFEVDNA